VTERALSGAEIVALVTEVADRLASQGHQHTVIVVGGSLLAWHGLRDTTKDVDCVSSLDDELRSAVALVAQEHDLELDWLNAHAAGFAPVTLEPSACTILLERPRLRVLGAPIRYVFLMKMYRGLPRDLDDLVAMWPHVAITSAEAIVEEFYEAFPHEELDPYLDELVYHAAERAGDAAFLATRRR
jgi:hypothetical protein